MSGREGVVDLASKKVAAHKFTADDLRKETEAIRAAFESLSSLDAAGRERAMQYLESLLSRGHQPGQTPAWDVPF